MGGASGVITGDTREEILKKAKKWYEEASKDGLWARDDFIYGHADTPIEYESAITGEIETAHVILVDMTKKPKNAGADLPFPMFSENLSSEEKKRRWFCFVSAHT